MKNKRGQTGGLITGLVFGVASLIIGVIIAFVIVSTLTGADLMSSTRSEGSVENETGWFNSTGYPLVEYDSVATTDFVITGLTNETHDFFTAGNYTLSNIAVLTNSTPDHFNSSIRINYTFNYYGASESSSLRLSSNLTEGVDNVSDKIPTVLLVAAIILILGVLAILVGVWQRMRMGEGSTL